MERELGTFDPASAPYLREVFRQGEATVYAVALDTVALLR
jgi:hypothetical protein